MGREQEARVGGMCLLLLMTYLYVEARGYPTVTRCHTRRSLARSPGWLRCRRMISDDTTAKIGSGLYLQ